VVAKAEPAFIEMSDDSSEELEIEMEPKAPATVVEDTKVQELEKVVEEDSDADLMMELEDADFFSEESEKAPKGDVDMLLPADSTKDNYSDEICAEELAFRKTEEAYFFGPGKQPLTKS